MAKLFLAVVSLGCSAILAFGGTQAPEPTKQRWEYGEFGRFKDEYAGGEAYYWECSAGIVKRSTLAELCKALGGESKNSCTTDFLNVLGTQGWDLISHSEKVYTYATSNYGGGVGLVTSAWTLKRPTR